MRQAHRERREQDLLPVADGGVPADVGLDLPFAAALRSEDRERQQLALVDGQKLSRIKIAEAVGGKIVLNVLLVLRRGGAQRSMWSPKIDFCAAMPSKRRLSSVTV